MSSQTIHYNFNIVGNANEVISAISQNSMALNGNMTQTLNVFKGFKGSLVGFQAFSSVIDNDCRAIWRERMTYLLFMYLNISYLSVKIRIIRFKKNTIAPNIKITPNKKARIVNSI